jgi:hypothetical protein
MAKPAKQVEVEVASKAAKKFVGEIMGCFERIDSERGKFMRAAKSERDRMTAIYEGMAALGVPQKSAKTHIKIARSLQKIQGWISELEVDEAKMGRKLAEAQGDRQQLSLWDSLPSDKPAKKRGRPKKAEQETMEWAEGEPAGQA